MIRSIFFAILLLHGLIHLLGVAKSFGWTQVPQLTQPIARPMGWFWLMASFLHLTAAWLYLSERSNWWIIGISAVLISQLLIFFLLGHSVESGDFHWLDLEVTDLVINRNPTP